MTSLIPLFDHNNLYCESLNTQYKVQSVHQSKKVRLEILDLLIFLRLKPQTERFLKKSRQNLYCQRINYALYAYLNAFVK